MTRTHSTLALTTLAALGLAAATPHSARAQSTPYYIVAGDDQKVTVVQNGAVVNTFAVPLLSYPIAVRDTVWLGNRDNAGGTEYTLAGTPTGNTSPGGASISQILDGTTDGTHNYGATCCSSTNVVTEANLDWSNQTPLFAVPNGEDAVGITFDTRSGSLYVGTYRGNLYEMSLTGAVLNTYTPVVDLSSLAYEQSTDTLWTANNQGSTIHQISTTGQDLQDITVPNANFGNNYGGEMPLAPAPEPSQTAALGVGLLGLAGLALRARKRTA